MNGLDPMGVAGLFLATLSCVGAFVLAAKQRYAAAVCLLLLAGTALRLELCSTPYLHEWDERYHALVAKNVMETPLVPRLYPTAPLPYNYQDWSANHIWVHKQPLPIWGMALSMAVFGKNELALRLPSLLLSTWAIWLVFAIGRAMYNSRVGYLAAFLMTIHGLLLELTAGMVATDHVDVFFMVLILLATLLALKYHQTENWLLNVLCGLVVGLAILCKWLPALIVLPLWLLFSWQYRGKLIFRHLQQLCVCGGVALVVFLPWQWYIFHAFPKEAIWEYGGNARHMFEVLDDRGGPFCYHFDKARSLYGELVYLPMLWLTWKAFTKWRDPKRWVLLVWIFVPFLFFSLAATKMQAYTLFTAPAMFLLTGLFIQHLLRYAERFKFPWLAKLVALAMLLLPVRYSLERSLPELVLHQQAPWAESLKVSAQQAESKVLFNYNRPIEAMFYGYALAYEHVPNKQELDTIIGLGYKIQVNDLGELPPYILQNDEVELIALGRY